MPDRYPPIPLTPRAPLSDDEMVARASAFQLAVSRRRTVREFSSRPVPRAVIESCIAAAGSAPSGANHQPWHFVAVSDPGLKQAIRVAAETEEREFYGGRAPETWLRELEPLGTDAVKPFLETAPWLIVIFARSHGIDAGGAPFKHYYVAESVGIAIGVLVTAVHDAGLASLTHTPSPMKFLGELLSRPANERAFLILVVGHPAADATVPDIRRLPLAEIATFRCAPDGE